MVGAVVSGTATVGAAVVGTAVVSRVAGTAVCVVAVGDGAGADGDVQPATMSDTTMQIRNSTELKAGEWGVNLISISTSAIFYLI